MDDPWKHYANERSQVQKTSSHLYEMYGIGKSIETEIRLVNWGENGEYKVSLVGNILKLSSGGVCTILWICQKYGIKEKFCGSLIISQ